MTFRGYIWLVGCAVSLLCALSLGEYIYWYLTIIMLLILFYSLVSLIWSFFTLRVTQSLSPRAIDRGGEAHFTLSAYQRCPLPVAPVTVVYTFGGKTEKCDISSKPFKEHYQRQPIALHHVGSYTARIDSILLYDLFGLLKFRKLSDTRTSPLLVLPNPFPIDRPEICQGDDGKAALARSQEDYNAPEDFRAYLPGDSMKRVHWKLSARKRELLVRRFESPAPPDTLILLDTSCPDEQNGNDKILAVRDALCETAAAIAKLQMEDASPVRMPLYGSYTGEFISDHSSRFGLLREMLASVPFSDSDTFAHVLKLELRRMRRTGAVIIITTRLNAAIVDAVSNIRRMGPSARLYYITYTPEAPDDLPYVSRLQHHLVEVCYVTPAS